MKVSEFLENIKTEQGYVNNSLYLKSHNNYGCVYKYLSYRDGKKFAIRKEVFIELDSEEAISGIDLIDKTFISSTEIYPAL